MAASNRGKYRVSISLVCWAVRRLCFFSSARHSLATCRRPFSYVLGMGDGDSDVFSFCSLKTLPL
ncbi:hypothetical protein ID856_06345 [Xenorhabdus sp. 18]|nr:hypothetical protein [Xenorhabdus sp. 18]